MISFAILAARLRGWSLSVFSLNVRDWRHNLNVGITSADAAGSCTTRSPEAQSGVCDGEGEG